MDIIKKFTHKDAIRRALLCIMNYPSIVRPLIEVVFSDAILGLNGRNIVIGYPIGYNVDLEIIFRDSLVEKNLQNKYR